MASNMSTVSTKQQRIAELAKQSPQMAFTTLAHYMDVEWLREAYDRTRKDAAAGVDGQTAADYERDLEGNLQRLLEQAQSGRYRAPPVRRVYIPKGTGGETRPLGIPTLEDKVLQRAVVMLLEPIFEHDFLPCSYGFRPRRSAHQALEALWQASGQGCGGWLLEVDIRKFFDTIDHRHLREFLQRRNAQGASLPACPLRDVHPSHRRCPVRARLGLVEQSLKVTLQILLVFGRRLAVDAHRCILARAVVRLT